MASNLINSNCTISVISHNMHGVNQGQLFLSSICALNTEVIFLQETWLNTADMFQSFQPLAEKYHIFCSSPLDKRQSLSVLKGRPFGGLCTLIHKSFFNLFSDIECIAADNNFIILRLDDFLFVNIYLPSSSGISNHANLLLILSNLIDCCSKLSHKDILIGGDCNCNVLTNSNSALFILNLLRSLDVDHSYKFLAESNNRKFSFCVPKRNAFSLIDFFFLSNNLGQVSSLFEILVGSLNFSDHLPIKITFPISDFATKAPSSIPDTSIVATGSSDHSSRIRIDWDKNRLDLYYECTRQYFFNLHDILTNLSLSPIADSRPDLTTSAGINSIYKNFIHGLLNCSIKCFKLKSNIFPKGKSWWDDDLRVAKANSIKCCEAWKSEGTSTSSPTFLRFQSAKKAFHNLVRKKKRAASNSINNDLLTSLNNCHQLKFWQIWKANFNCQKSSSKFKFEGLTSDPDIANYLASQHRSNCAPHSETKNEEFKTKYLANINSHKSAIFYPNFSITTVMLDNAISKIANHTAPGIDDICIEHFKYAHPSVIAILKSLLNLFLTLGEVPFDFGLGLVTPIPKFKGHKINVNADYFRGITINSVVSKILEHCILPSLNSLSTSSRQFGFKKGTSCTHALNLLKNTTNFFNRKGHTISMAFIDIRKAFDRVSCWGILSLLQSKLINPTLVDTLAHC